MNDELRYEARGSGPTLLLLHGFPFDRRMWEEELARLSVGRRVVAVDLRGFGESPLWGEPSIDDLGDDVVRLCDRLGVAMGSICGFSMGGYVAFSIYARHAARVSALVLADTRAASDTEVGLAARRSTIAQLRDDGAMQFLDGVPERLLSRHADNDLRSRVRGLCVEKKESLIAATRAMAERPDRTPLLPTIECPTLVLCGGEDATSPAPEMRGIAQAIRGAEYAELAGVGHLSNLEAPDRFNDTVARFLAAHEL
jgi:pimeloyl-ACP methyl ester carboxylesterase